MLLNKAIDYLKKNGLRAFLVNVDNRTLRMAHNMRLLRRYHPAALWAGFRYRFRQRLEIWQAGQLLRRSFPEKADRSAAPGAKYDAAAETALTLLLARLDLQADPADTIAHLKKKMHRGPFILYLIDLFLVERHLRAAASRPPRGIIQAAELPPLKGPAPRRNILFITSMFPSPFHGGGNRVLNFLRYLSRDHDLYLASRFIPGEDAAALPAAEPYCKSILKLPHWRFNRAEDSIRKWLAGKKMDIVHYEWPNSLTNFHPENGTTQIFTYMEAVTLRLLMDMRNLESLSPRWVEKLAELTHALRVEIADASHLQARIAVTTKDAEFFQALDAGQEYTVLNHGLTFEEFVLPESPSEPRTLVFVGNYQHYPNMDAMDWFFSEIWGRVRAAVPDARIYVVGANPLPRLRDLANEHIYVTGSVADVRPYIQKATVCIAPLISGAGLRGKLIEYAALRRPFVATPIAATDLVFEDGRDFFCAEQAADFADRIITLLKDPQRAGRMGESAYETARAHYDTPRLADFLERIYARLEGQT